MKPLLLLFITCFCIKSYCQIDHIKVMLGKNENEVLDYVDSLCRGEDSVTIERSYTQDGDLYFICTIPLGKTYACGCDFVDFTFLRISGTEYCFTQDVLGSYKYSNPGKNINYVKDNFNLVDSNIYEHYWTEKYKLIAKIQGTPPDNSMFKITYKLEEIK